MLGQDWPGTGPSPKYRLDLANGVLCGKDGHWHFQGVLRYVPTVEGGSRCTFCPDHELRRESYPSNYRAVLLMVRALANNQ